MQIIYLCPGDTKIIQQVAAFVVDSFKEHWPDAWPNTDML